MEVSSKIISGKDLLEEAKKEDWASLQVILVAHVIKRLKYRYDLRENNKRLADRANGIISELLDLTLIQGRRNWNTNKYDSFQDFLISVLDSHLYNKYAKSKPKEEYTDAVPDKSSDPSPEDQIAYEELKKKAYDFLVDDGATDDELLVFDCMTDGIVKPKSLREELGISKEDFHNIWRRLQSRIKKLRVNLGRYE